MKLATLVRARLATHSARLLTAVIVGAVGTGPSAHAATMTLVPVSATGNYNIVGDRINVEPGATVTLEIRVAGWAPSLLQTAQATIDSSGYSSGAAGTLAPLTTPTVADGAFIDPQRSDYVFFGVSSIEAVDTATLNYRWGAVHLSGGTADPGSSRYLGTLKLVVPGNAAGIFTVGFFPSPDSFLADDNAVFIPLVDIVPAEVFVAECVVDSDCDDGILCTLDTCNSGTCTNTPVDALCDDGLFCNGVEICDPIVGCFPGAPPCESAPCNEVLTQCQPTRLYVDAAAVGQNTGLSWGNAQRRLQDALVSAGGTPTVTEIWVAKGTYKPTEQSCVTAGDCGGDPCTGGQCAWISPRQQTFQLLNGVALYGGFVGGSRRCLGGTNDGAACTNDAQCPGGICGGGETLLSHRDFAANPTILSGDLNGDDGPNFINNGENSHHVVTGSGTEVTAILDGFTITAGHADGTAPDDGGAGMFNNSGSHTVANCTFDGNSSNNHGGGVYNVNSSPLIRDCLFRNNLASNGAAVLNDSGSNPIVADCVFVGNLATNVGGAMYNTAGTPTITNCTFSDNSANIRGGAMINENNGNPTVTNCTFSGNSASLDGGAMFILSSSSPAIVNCTFTENWTNGNGGGIVTATDASPTVSNSIFWRNVDDADATAGGPFMDESAQIHVGGGTMTINRSLAQGLTGALGGTGNIGSDPLFMDPVVGNLRLRSGSPAIDAGDSTAVPVDTSDLDGDLNTSERTPIDLGGYRRFVDDPATIGSGIPPARTCVGGSNNGSLCTLDPDCPGGGVCTCVGVPSCGAVVDMGALEYFTDCNDNGIPDECDLNCEAPGAFCGPGCDGSADCNTNNVPDECDIAACVGNPSCRACVGGANHGAPCEEPADCPGGACGKPNDDCNQNRVPDGCDIANLTSADANVDGVPDECVQATGGGGTINWSDGGNWPLAGKFPDNIDPVNGVPQRYVTIDGTTMPTVLVDRTIEVNSLRLINSPRLLVIQVDSAKQRSPQTAAGDLAVLEKLLNGGTVEVANNRAITVGDELTVAANGIYRAAPGAGADGCPSGVVCASLTAGSITVQPGDCDKVLFGGEISLSGDMELVSTGSLSVIGSPSPDCPVSSGSVADTRGITPPPKFTVRNVAAVYAAAVAASGAVDSLLDSSDAIVVTGDFDNGAQFPSLVNWTQGTIQLEGPSLHQFEAAGLDLGPSAEGLLTDSDTLFDTAQHTNFSLGRLFVGPGASDVYFVNRKVNAAGLSACAEAVYVDVLEVSGPVPVLFHLENVRVYYRVLIGVPPVVVPPLGCGALVPMCDIPTPAVAETVLNAAGALVPSVKNRFLSFFGGNAGLSLAVRVKFASLPGAFGIYDGTTAWVGLPQTASELPGKGLTDPVGADPTFRVARLVDAPVYADWSTFGVVHVHDERIIPSRKLPGQPLEPAVYEVQFVGDGCDTGSEASFSPALSITNAQWGDVASLVGGQFRAPDGAVGVTEDVLAVLAKFGNAPGAPMKARAEIVGTGLTGPQASLTGKVDISDVLAVLGAFSGGSYPFSPP